MKNKELTPRADLSKDIMGIGPKRTRKPVYQDYLPPCNHACPAGENIQAWLGLVQEARYYEAWLKLTEDNPFPAIHGRVCYHPCEDHCNRGQTDTSVSIHSIERFLGDRAIEENWQFMAPESTSGHKVLIIGAGPSGLSAACHLARLGHEVTVYEAGPMAGGMMHFGIPAYRLPRNIIHAEIKRLEALGVRFKLNYKVSDIVAEKKAGGFDAVFVAIGAHIGKKVKIPAREAGKILDAVTFLKDVETGNAPKLGRKVVVYGGGNTAMDAARTVKRLGADEAMIIYRRDREHMPAHAFEADEALSEGVQIHWLRSIKEITETSFTVEVMRIEEGKPVGTGVYETIEADALILALGQETDTAFLKKVPGIDINDEGVVVVGPNMMTGAYGIFAGGDMVPSERTVTVAVGHGKKAARFIHAFLRGEEYHKPPAHPLISYESLHLWYDTEAPKSEQGHLPPQAAVQGFNEIVAGISEKEARYEAQRCYSCGNCFECDGCYGSCPEGAILKLGKGNRYEFNYQLCTGCAVCFEQCPCHAIEMVPES
ncbi:MAG TPA: NAD(P)-binding protein [Saprospiraceae bacterium]|nr:NAD(P)-binding protein [Saprospiraceae bacterium]HNT19730.1 NAD(P)-binding protein [Saprospiraceae bacterium]